MLQVAKGSGPCCYQYTPCYQLKQQHIALELLSEVFWQLPGSARPAGRMGVLQLWHALVSDHEMQDYRGPAASETGLSRDRLTSREQTAVRLCMLAATIAGLLADHTCPAYSLQRRLGPDGAEILRACCRHTSPGGEAWRWASARELMELWWGRAGVCGLLDRLERLCPPPPPPPVAAQPLPTRPPAPPAPAHAARGEDTTQGSLPAAWDDIQQVGPVQDSPSMSEYTAAQGSGCGYYPTLPQDSWAQGAGRDEEEGFAETVRALRAHDMPRDKQARPPPGRKTKSGLRGAINRIKKFFSSS